MPTRRSGDRQIKSILLQFIPSAYGPQRRPPSPAQLDGALQTLALLRVGGWRKTATLTPGLVKEALTRRFRDCEAFRLVPTTRAKLGPVRGTGPPECAAAE